MLGVCRDKRQFQSDGVLYTLRSALVVVATWQTTIQNERTCFAVWYTSDGGSRARPRGVVLALGAVVFSEGCSSAVTATPMATTARLFEVCQRVRVSEARPTACTIHKATQAHIKWVAGIFMCATIACLAQN